MNYFAHGRDFVDNPYFLAGTAVPDWLSVVDRRVRVRSRHAQTCIDHPDPRLAAVAQGIARHHQDDAWFHQTRSFSELSWQLTVKVRDRLPADDGLRPSFLGHILVEILLDAALIAENPARLEAYYKALDSVDGGFVESAVNRMASGTTERLGRLIPLFVREQFLWDYADDAKLCTRLNQVMRRVNLASLPDQFRTLLPEARQMVQRRQRELLLPDEAPGVHL